MSKERNRRSFLATVEGVSKLRGAMGDKGYTREKIAEITGVSLATINNLFNPNLKRKVGESNLVLIANTLELKPKDIVGNEWDSPAITTKPKSADSGINPHDSNNGNAEQQSIDDNQVNTIFTIIKSNKDNSEFLKVVLMAYSRTIPDGWLDDWREKATEINDIFNQLKEIPHLNSNDSPVLRFVHFVCEENIPQTIRDKFEQVLSIKSKYFKTSARSTPPQQLHSYLLIRFCLTGTNELSVQACCIPDDTICEIYERFKPLTVEEQQVAIPFVAEKMYLLLSNLIKQFYENHIKGRSADLTIEIFLPSDRLHDEVEKWSYEDSEGMVLTIGKEHMVVVRSYDRLKNSYTQIGTNWRNRWGEVQPSLRNILSIEQVRTVNEAGFDCNELRNCLVRKNVLMVSCELTNQQRKGLLKAIHSAGTPIVIWSRSEVQNLNNPKNFDALITEPLHQLTAQVKQQRWEAKSDKDLGNHLVLLWDDPNRIPPRSIFEVPAS